MAQDPTKSNDNSQAEKPSPATGDAKTGDNDSKWDGNFDFKQCTSNKWTWPMSTFDPHSLEISKNGMVYARRPGNGAFFIDSALPAAIKELLRQRYVTVEMQGDDFQIDPREITVAQFKGVPYLITCGIQGSRRDNGKDAVGGIWFEFKTEEDLQDRELQPIAGERKVEIMLNFIAGEEDFESKMMKLERFSYNELIKDEMRNCVIFLVNDHGINIKSLGKIFDSCSAIKTSTDPDAAIQQFLENVV